MEDDDYSIQSVAKTAGVTRRSGTLSSSGVMRDGSLTLDSSLEFGTGTATGSLELRQHSTDLLTATASVAEASKALVTFEDDLTVKLTSADSQKLFGKTGN